MPKSQAPRRKYKPVERLEDMQAQMEMVEKATHPAYAALDLGYRKVANEDHAQNLIGFLAIGRAVAQIQKATEVCLPAIDGALEMVAHAAGDLNNLKDYEQTFHGLNVAFELCKACSNEVYEKAVYICTEMIEQKPDGETLQ